MGQKNKIEFKLHHIGIAVKGIGPVMAVLSNTLGLDFEAVENVDPQKVNVTFSKQKPSIELVEATQENSAQFPILPHPIAAFIKNRGQGLHHICFSVSNIVAAYDKFTTAGVKIVGSEISTGSKGKKVFFIDPAETAGILIEIKEEKE